MSPLVLFSLQMENEAVTDYVSDWVCLLEVYDNLMGKSAVQMPYLKDDCLYKTELFQPKGLRENSCRKSDIVIVRIHNTCWSCERLESLLSNPVGRKF